MKLLFLGTGTSTGVPSIGCDCPTCRSLDPADKRLRASALVTTDAGERLLIDCGPDFRGQILGAGAPPLDALLITHSHYDHVGGIDDLRPYCAGGRHFPTYCTADVAADLRRRNPWSFAAKLYPGVPTFAIHEIRPSEPFTVGSTEIIPLPVMHAALPIVGYRIGPLAYITDCKTMPEATVDLLKGIDTLVLNALRPAPHMSHLSLDEALALAARIGARRTLLTHMSHDMPPAAAVALPPGITLARDGMTITI
ncbi:MAG: MBL fold metallo-hydrolase [Bacteroides sp.]|nr:MBL fold metallo-hydrolase [Bacteroides sp.]MCM1095439.1 MBL fold metallo-hydrolase [Terasakiella sp.]